MVILGGNMYKLLKGDCLEMMKTIPDKSIDMILCDLPYGTTNCKWDNIIPFEPLWEQYERIIKDNGAIVLFGSEPFSSKLKCSNLNLFKYDWIWKKSRTVGFLNAKNAPLKDYEVISVFSKGTTANGSKKNMKYYPQGLIEINKPKKSVKQANDTIVGNRPSRNKDYIAKYTNYPKAIIQFNNERKQLHPTQKPVSLLEYLIKTYTNENDVVLDNCMGSGSTGVACINTNRKFVGIELDNNYFEIAKNRIEDVSNSKLQKEVKEC
jgi:site-specific DNA-methyltransferase (adenine-specific)